MSKVFETGHAKNVANFEKLISFCKGYGDKFKPAADGQQLSALNELYNQANEVMTLLNQSKTQYDNATNNRADVFDDNRTYATRVVNALRATDAYQGTIDDIEGINRKIQGARAAKPKHKEEENKEEGTEDTGDNTISVSQRSYDSIVVHYRQLYEALAAEPLYTPNETDINLAGLKLKISGMTKANSNVIHTYINLQNTRIKRNKILYNEKTRLIEIAKKVKKYVKSIYGNYSEEAIQIADLQFKKPKERR